MILIRQSLVQCKDNVNNNSYNRIAILYLLRIMLYRYLYMYIMYKFTSKTHFRVAHPQVMVGGGVVVVVIKQSDTRHARCFLCEKISLFSFNFEQRLVAGLQFHMCL